jgi:hypothetical protein
MYYASAHVFLGSGEQRRDLSKLASRRIDPIPK